MDSSLMFEAPHSTVDDAYGYPQVGSSPPSYSGSLLPDLYDDRAVHQHHQQQQQHRMYYADVKLEEPSMEHHLGHSASHHHSHYVSLQPSNYYSYGMAPPAYSHSQLPIQHTDDAASKETQYLRRRCFNCHTTEPPSWRRSTLQPGKIVCNKCGLYERTHLRPRPLRFDELRAGNKSRKNSTSIKKAALKPMPIAKAPSRRSPPQHKLQDWDDSLSLYSNSSSSTSSYPSPGSYQSTSPYSHALPLPHSSPSVSPPPIRLPIAPFQQTAVSY